MKTTIVIGILSFFFIERAFSQNTFPKSEKEDKNQVMSSAYWQIWSTDVQQKIDRDIDKNRKADAVLQISDVKIGTELKIEQISHDFIFGAHIFNYNQLGTKELNDKYKNLYGTLFNSATIAFYWNKHEITPGKPRYEEEYRDTEAYWNNVKDPKAELHWRRPATDPVVEFCESKGIRLHGHTLVWGNRRWHFPGWIAGDLMTPEEKLKMDGLVKTYASDKNTLKEEMYQEEYKKLSPAQLADLFPAFTTTLAETQEKRIKEIANHYKGRLQSWDVVNESAKDYNAGNLISGASLSKSWYGLMPGDYDYTSLRTAKEAFPENVALNINDYDMGEAYANQVKSLLARGSKIDIMGSQMHKLGTKGSLEASEGKEIETPHMVWERMNIFSRTGLPVHLSEVTIASPAQDEKGLAIQAILTQNMYRLWFSIQPLMGITWWNVVDDCGAAGESAKSGLFTREMQPKPAFYAINNLINKEWITRETIKVQKDGQVKFRGFKGKYRVTWTDKSGKVQHSEFYLKKDGDGFYNQSVTADVCVYGATASGIMAAIAVKKEGKSVVLVEPGRWVGGILGAGIKPQQDCPNINATGGMTRPLIESLGVRNSNPNWKEINPKDIRADLIALLKQHKIDIVYQHRISRCEVKDGKINQAFFDFAPFDEYGIPPEKSSQSESLSVKSKVFIDCSYEGDLMYFSGVTFRVGRDANVDYDEKTAGVQVPTKLTPIDPFVIPGLPSSGLLKMVEKDHNKPTGSGDHFTQAYNYRYYLTTDPRFKVAITPPNNYNAADFELVGRYVAFLIKENPDRQLLFKQLSGIFPGWLNANEYNYQRASLITIAPVAISHRYASGDWATKANIWRQHKDYLSGLHHFLSTDSRVPVEFREQTAALGLDIRPHQETKGWPHQLYIRVSRRLLGNYTVTEHDVLNKTMISDPIGLAQYGIDVYPLRRIWLEKEGKYYVGLEGSMFVGGAKGPTNKPYPIPYRAITPLKNECQNLLVPVCLSASHVGYASVRMEPVFMITGESAGIAAAQAITENVAVQDIDMLKYRNTLKAAKQLLQYDGNK
ncbi:FAD-dependent oxidoreductase [Pedobacter sp. MC2016-14]|uniref:FAD-dependent oxidoreductase n=1 Tax=Pedobacter sp. MC2016-14 TaxID=2897327 RepID=UPI001E4A3DF2|nr:FAD-dependent oxidoreductase [Pedobacter sp. MC2016-14]MCD0488819.1 FAD-dependent oxidoreductase [Pedobacter sp. MC2016-14]